MNDFVLIVNEFREILCVLTIDPLNGLRIVRTKYKFKLYTWNKALLMQKIAGQYTNQRNSTPNSRTVHQTAEQYTKQRDSTSNRGTVYQTAGQYTKQRNSIPNSGTMHQTAAHYI